MARRKGWGRPQFLRSDELTLLDIMGAARDRAIKMGSAAGYGSDRDKRASALMEAIDAIAEDLTGDRKYFHDKGSSGPNYGPGFAHIGLNLDRTITDAIHRYIDEQGDDMTREAAVEAIVVDALVGLGLMEFAESPHERREDAN